MSNTQTARCRVYSSDGPPQITAHELAPAQPLTGIHAPVSTIMTRDVVCAQRALTVEGLIQLMVRHHVGCVPIVNDRMQPIGMVTKLDLVEKFGTASTALADDVMTPNAITLDQHASIAQVTAVMAAEELHHIPIVSASGAVIGIISTLDVVRWLAQDTARSTD